MTFQLEKLADILPEVIGLFNSHYEEPELKNLVDKMPLKPNWYLYLNIEAQGILLFATLREDGKIVGYYAGTVGPSLHHKTTMTNLEDVYWIHPDKRSNGAAKVLFDNIKDLNKEIGIKFWNVGARINTPASKFLLDYGFTKTQERFGMWLGD